MKKTIIVMPVANEEKTMDSIIKEILSLPYDNLYLYTVIDNYSKDRTEEIIRSYESTGKVKCIFYKNSTGVTSCYLHGFKIALKDGAERIIEMDGGGSHLPSQIPSFIEKLDEGYDCIFGSRFIKNGTTKNQTIYRKILSYGGTLLANLVLNTKYKDMTSGFEAFQANILKKMNLDKFLSKGHMYQTEMRFYCRQFNWVEIPINYIGGSSSSLKFKSVTEALKILFKLKKYEKQVLIHDELKYKVKRNEI